VNERGSSLGNATKNANVLRDLRASRPAHNGLVAGRVLPGPRAFREVVKEAAQEPEGRTLACSLASRGSASQLAFGLRGATAPFRSARQKTRLDHPSTRAQRTAKLALHFQIHDDLRSSFHMFSARIAQKSRGSSYT
jgi:hypothetical protein